MKIKKLNRNLPTILDKVAKKTEKKLEKYRRENPVMIGIHSGGVMIAKALHQRMGLENPLGQLNIRYYRDDFSKTGLHPDVQPSDLPESIEGRHIILVDDVLYSGRTIRAAHNELFDYGRPASVLLVVLIQRDGRELPIQADVSGCYLDLNPSQHVKWIHRQPLQFEIRDIASKTIKR